MTCTTYPDTTLDYVNDTFARAFGMDADELMGKRWIDCMPHGARRRVMAVLESITEADPFVRVQHFATVDGRRRLHRWEIVGLFEAGKLVRIGASGVVAARSRKRRDRS